MDAEGSDYACLDFEEGLPDESQWASNIVGSASLATSSDRALSPASSLRTTVPQAAAFADRTSAQLIWTPVGATQVQSVNVDFALNPTAVPGALPPWTGSVRLVCIDVGGGTVCLAHTVSSERMFAANYTGLFISWVFVSGAALTGECEVLEPLEFGLWNSVQLRAAADGSISLQVNGANAIAGCTTGGFTSDTVAEISLGLSTIQSTTWSFESYYDNVEVSVTRVE